MTCEIKQGNRDDSWGWERCQGKFAPSPLKEKKRSRRTFFLRNIALFTQKSKFLRQKYNWAQKNCSLSLSPYSMKWTIATVEINYRNGDLLARLFLKFHIWATKSKFCEETLQFYLKFWIILTHIFKKPEINTNFRSVGK